MESKTPKTVSEKKLKQARLPFQIISRSPKDSVPACKKLKLDSQLNPPLTNDLETKENIKIEADKQNNSEKDTLTSNDEDSIQLIEPSSEKNSPEKIKVNDASEIKPSDDPMEIDEAVDSENKGADTSETSDKNKTLKPDSDKLVTSAISDSSKRKITEEDKSEDSQNKKAKLDVKSKLSIFARKGSAKKLAEPIKDNNREDLKPVNSEIDSSQKKAEKITDLADEGEKKKDDSKTGADEKLDEVITVNDESSSDEAKDKKNNEEENSRHSTSSKGSTDRHIIFHDFDAKASSSSNADTPPVTPKSKKLPEEGSKKKSAKKLTPKQLQKEAEMAKRKQEKERLLEEKRKKLEEEKEEKKRKREEKEEERKKLKEEKERLKNEEKEKKEEEKRKKEEQKLEEKRKKEEEKRKKEEETQKKKEEEELSKKKKFVKEAEAFSSFFKKVDVKSEPAVQTENKSVEETMFMPFTVKPDMRLAPINRNPMDPERVTKFDEKFNCQTVEETYLSELKSKKIIPKKSGDTWPLEEKYDEVVVLEEEIELNETPDVAVVPERKHKNLRAKLFQFHENRRPPYWGTWRKKSKNITARKPFGKDTVFDYEVDSDDEWEEEEPGESLHGSDDEKEPEDDYEVDNDFFVPHGYLSDDENPEEDEILSPETQKAKLKLLGEQFDQERNEKTRQLRPITIGCIWFKNDTDEPEGVNPSIIKLLNKRKAVVWGEAIPIIVQRPEKQSEGGDASSSQAATPSSSKKVKFPESAVPFLINMLHGNTCSRKKIIQKFLLNWKDGESQVCQGDSNANLLTKTCVTKKIRELSSWQEFPDEGPACMANKMCWYVKKEFRDKYGITDIPLPNKWDDVAEGNSDKKGSPSLITKFTKVLTAEERKSQLKSKSKARKSINTTEQKSPSDGKKSAKKLLHFWTKQPNQAQSSTSEDMEVCPINQDETVETSTKKATESVEKSGKMPEVVTIDDDSNPAKTEIQSQKDNSTDGAGPSTSSKTSEDQKPAAKKRVPILFSAPRGCEIKKQNSAEKEKSKDENSSTDKEQKIVSTHKSECEVAKPNQESKSDSAAASTTVATDNKVNGENSKPTVKKRVPILVSAPKGCEIKKPITSSTQQNSAEKEKRMNQTEQASTDEKCPTGDQKILNAEKCESEAAKPTQESKSETTEASRTGATVNGENSKPAAKKRVPILFSAPRGCDIKKPKTEANGSQKAATE